MVKEFSFLLYNKNKQEQSPLLGPYPKELKIDAHENVSIGVRETVSHREYFMRSWIPAPT